MDLHVNGKWVSVKPGPEGRKLLHVLRDELGLAGTRYGCGIGVCGACTVHVNGRAVRSCQIAADGLGNKKITTIEGLGQPSQLHPVQRAFITDQVPQCGFCMSGQIMTAAALLTRNPRPSDAQINAAMKGNICRCAAYVRIRRAVRRAAGSGA